MRKLYRLNYKLESQSLVIHKNEEGYIFTINLYQPFPNRTARKFFNLIFNTSFKNLDVLTLSISDKNLERFQNGDILDIKDMFNMVHYPSYYNRPYLHYLYAKGFNGLNLN